MLANQACYSPIFNSDSRSFRQQIPNWTNMSANNNNNGFNWSQFNGNNNNNNNNNSSNKLKHKDIQSYYKKEPQKRKSKKRAFIETFSDEDEYYKSFPNNRKQHINDRMVIKNVSLKQSKIDRKRSWNNMNSETVDHDGCKDNDIKIMDINTDDTINGLQKAVKKLRLHTQISPVLLNNQNKEINCKNILRTHDINPNKMNKMNKMSIIPSSLSVVEIKHPFFVKLNSSESYLHRNQLRLNGQSGALVAYHDPAEIIDSYCDDNKVLCDVKEFTNINCNANDDNMNVDNDINYHKKKRAVRLHPTGLSGGNRFRGRNQSEQLKKYVNQCYVSSVLNKNKQKKVQNKENKENENNNDNDDNNDNDIMDCD